MKVEIVTFNKTLLVGKYLPMSFMDNKTQMLWQSLMPKRHLINNRIDDNLISLQVYPANNMPKPNEKFTKWAGAFVTNVERIPEGFEYLEIPQGLYAVFDYQGAAKDFHVPMNFIFNQWLPNSEYELDHRPHFEMLPAGYDATSATAQEKIYIPIK